MRTLTLALLLSACASQTAPVSHRLRIDADLPEDVQAAAEEAAHAWNTALGRDVFLPYLAEGPGEYPAGEIYVGLLTASSADRMGECYNAPDGGAQVFVRADATRAPLAGLDGVLAHELGHALGLEHDDGPDLRSIMRAGGPAEGPWRISAESLSEAP